MLLVSFDSLHGFPADNLISWVASIYQGSRISGNKQQEGFHIPNLLCHKLNQMFHNLPCQHLGDFSLQEHFLTLPNHNWYEINKEDIEDNNI